MGSPLVDKNGVTPGQKLTLLAVSDVVEPQLYNSSVKEWLPHIDLLVSCGDLPTDYLDFLASNLDSPFVHVRGNHCYVAHDPDGRCSSEAYLGALNLDGRIAEHEGLIMVGIEGSPVYNMGPHQYSDAHVALKLLRLAPGLLREKIHTGRYLDLLVTHAPPRGIHDHDDTAHKGFEALLKFIEVFKPAVMLHGHSHRYDPLMPVRTRYCETEILNVYGHVVLELTRDEQRPGWHISASKADEVTHG
jgi:hypothetical protein